MRIKYGYLSTLLLFLTISINAQVLQKPSENEISTLPLWAKEMYSDNPNVFKVDSLYDNYYKLHTFVKNFHTQYYKRWKHTYSRFVDNDGFIKVPSPETQTREAEKQFKKRNHSPKSGNWSSIGPFTTKTSGNNTIAEQTNVYSITQCISQPQVLYCGTEPGEIYKSADGGNTWFCVSESLATYGGITAIAVNPNNPDTIFAAGGSYLFASVNGGNNWTIVLQMPGLNTNELLIHPTHTNLIFVAAEKGFFRSSNSGATFNQIFTEKCYDVKLRPNTDNIVYLLKNNPTEKMAEFWLSTDYAQTFTIQQNGWYYSSDANKIDYGARIGVTPAEPLRVYAYLIGDSKPDDYGYIGLFRSDDGGINWYLPNSPVGGPYTDEHPNLAYGTPDWTYHQGFYNCAIMVSKTDADKVLIGGLNLWSSNDGAYTFTGLSGYIGGALHLHVDMQDFRETPFGSWITCDGGIYFSDNFFATEPIIKMEGVRGSEYWGFGQGWNDDITIGGLYHNGVTSHFENYGEGINLNLGGAEPASGYVNPGPERKVLSSEIGGRILPLSIGENIGSFSVGMFPNESYWAAESSEMEWNPKCYNTIWLGKNNILYRSDDGGISFNAIHTFYSDENERIQAIEISMLNPNVMYVSQRPYSGSNGRLFKTIDGGIVWSQLPLPSGSSNRILLSINPSNADNIYLAYASGNNTQKIYASADGGNSWSNLTTNQLADDEIRSIVAIPCSNGGIYAFGYYNVYYRDSLMTDWIVESDGLPAIANTCIAKPFFRDGKIRNATYGKGIWESNLHTLPSKPIACIMTDKFETSIFCHPDTFHFDDHSIIQNDGTTRSWTFQGGNPTVSGERNPEVVFETPGTYQITLTVTNQQGISDSDTISIIVNQYINPGSLNEGFENGFLPDKWYSASSETGGNWTLNSQIGGFGNSTNCTFFDNFNYDAQSGWSDIFIKTDLTNLINQDLKFDVAYTPYGGQYSDTLEVRISTDCSENWTTIYRKGGEELSTAPAYSAGIFVPQSSEWRTDSVDLSAYEGMNDVIISFRNIGHWGQALYLDNILLINPNSTENVSLYKNKLFVFPNPAISGNNIYIQNYENETIYFRLSDNNGKEILKCLVNENNEITLPELVPAIYFYSVATNKQIINGKLAVYKQRK